MGLMVKLGLDGKAWEEGLNKASNDASNFANKVGGGISKNMLGSVTSMIPALSSALAGAFSAHAIYEAVNEFGDKVKEIAEGALRLNVDTTTFQKLNNVMEFAGMKGEDVAQAFDHIAQSILKIKRGEDATGYLQQDLAKFGLTMDSIGGMNASQIFFKITEALHGVKPSDDQIAALKELTGRAGPEILKVAQIGFNGQMANKEIIPAKDIETLERVRELAASSESAWTKTWNKIAGGAKETFYGVQMILKGSFGQMVYETFGSDAQKKQREMTAEKQAEVSAAIQRLAMNKAAANAAQHIREKAEAIDAKKAAAIEKETDAIAEKNRIESLSSAEKQLEIKKQIVDLEAGIKFDDTKGRADVASDKKKIEELKGELSKFHKDAPEKNLSLQHLHALGNQTIGGIMLSHDRIQDELKRSASKSAKHLESIDKKTHMPNGGGSHEFP